MLGNRDASSSCQSGMVMAIVEMQVQNWKESNMAAAVWFQERQISNAAFLLLQGSVDWKEGVLRTAIYLACWFTWPSESF
jgi:hypothetical protein